MPFMPRTSYYNQQSHWPFGDEGFPDPLADDAELRMAATAPEDPTAKQPTALESYRSHIEKPPTAKPKWWQRPAAAGLGGAQGYLEVSGFKGPDQQVQQAIWRLTHPGREEWEQERERLGQLVGVEEQESERERKRLESEARIGALQATAGWRRAQQRKTEMPPLPRAEPLPKNKHDMLVRIWWPKIQQGEPGAWEKYTEEARKLDVKEETAANFDIKSFTNERTGETWVVRTNKLTGEVDQPVKLEGVRAEKREPAPSMVPTRVQQEEKEETADQWASEALMNTANADTGQLDHDAAVAELVRRARAGEIDRRLLNQAIQKVNESRQRGDKTLMDQVRALGTMLGVTIPGADTPAPGGPGQPAAPAAPAASAPPAGRIRVRLADGQTGTIDAREFDPRTMTRLE